MENVNSENKTQSHILLKIRPNKNHIFKLNNIVFFSTQKTFSFPPNCNVSLKKILGFKNFFAFFRLKFLRFFYCCFPVKMQGEDSPFKIFLVGDHYVGKTSLINRFTEDSFVSTYISTIGVDFKRRNVTINGEIVQLQIWDTAGQEKFRTITSSYYRGTHGIIIVYDICDKVSFDNLTGWIEEVDKNTGKGVIKLIMGNKVDKKMNRIVDYNTAKQYADDRNIKYIETSAKSSENVTEAFTLLTEEILKVTNEGNSKQPKEKNTVDLSKQTLPAKQDSNSADSCPC